MLLLVLSHALYDSSFDFISIHYSAVCVNDHKGRVTTGMYVFDVKLPAIISPLHKF